MQNLKIIRQELRKQKDLNARKRRLIIHAFDSQYDPLLQYADRDGKVEVTKNLHFKANLIPALRKMGYELYFDENGKEMLKKL